MIIISIINPDSRHSTLGLQPKEIAGDGLYPWLFKLNQRGFACNAEKCFPLQRSQRKLAFNFTDMPNGMIKGVNYAKA